MSENSLLEEIYSVLKSKYIDYKDDEQNKNLILKDCPFCQDNNYHFYLGVTVDNLGLWNCFKCGGGHEGGAKNWYRLKKALLGDELIIHAPFQPQHKKAINEKTKFILEWNTALYSDVDTLEWLYKERNIHPDLVNTYKLGVTTITSPTTKKQVKALTIPYFFKNNLVNVKFRVLPPEPKEFIRLPNAQSILYNYDHIDLTQNYIFICEGELDAISLVQAGETNVVSITVGAKSFIPEWYDLLKKFELIYLVLDNDVVGQEGAKVLAERLGKDKCLNILLPYGTKDNPIKDLNDYFKEHNINEFKGVALRATNFPLDTIYTVESVTEGIIRRLEGGRGLLEGLETPWPSLNQKMGVMARGDLIYLSAKPKVGKCLCKSSMILTNYGLLSIEEIFNHLNIKMDQEEEVVPIADKNLKLYSEGKTYPVSHLTINGNKDVYKVQTKLGLEIDITSNHPLLSIDKDGKIKWKECSQLEVGDYLVVDRSKISFMADANLSPYEGRLLGYLIADGCLSSRTRINFSNSNLDVINDYQTCCKEVFGNNIVVKSYPQSNSNGVDHHIEGIKLRTQVYEQYGLGYVGSKDKIIPLCIRKAPSDICKEFLKSYFECEGYITHKFIEVSSASYKLVHGIQLLLLPLGIISSLRKQYNKKYKRYYYKLTLFSTNAVKFCQEIGFISNYNKIRSDKLLEYNNSINKKPNQDTIPYQSQFISLVQNDCNTDMIWNHLTNKLKRGTRNPSYALLTKIVKYCHSKGFEHPTIKYWEDILSKSHQYFDKIISITYIGKEPTFDLVQPETHSFTANGIINHNTTIALNICYNLSMNSKVPTLLFCLEMPPDRLVHKLIARHRMVDNVLLDDVYMTKLQFQENDIPLYFGYTTEKKYLNIDSITKLFELARKKYGIELFVFDNLQFLCRSISHVYQEVAKVSRDFKLLAMNLNVPIIVIAQPRKLAETELMSSVDLKDSASLEADADTILIAHRKSLIKESLNTVQLEHDSNLSPIVRIAVDRCRYAIGGFTSLYFSASKSFLREATAMEMSEV